MRRYDSYALYLEIKRLKSEIEEERLCRTLWTWYAQKLEKESTREVRLEDTAEG